MPKQFYPKRALSFPEQILHLESNGMAFFDKELALKELASISYYRLSGYWYPFRVRNKLGNVTDEFELGTSFSSTTALYEFDRKLRGLVLDAIERIEVAVRTQFTYHIGRKYGAFGHTDANNFHPSFNHKRLLRKLKEERQRSSEDFIRHYETKYEDFQNLPIWMLTEVMSLGTLSFGYSGLLNNQKLGIEDKKAVSEHFNIHHKEFGDWLHTLTYVRNICAHHSRLWNKKLAIRPGENKSLEWRPPLTPRNDRVFYILLMLRHLLRATGNGNGNDWAASVNKLITPVAKEKRWRAAMGLPENWLEHPIWK